MVIYQLCEGRLAKGRLPESKETIVQQYLTQDEMHKDRYQDSMRKNSLGNYEWGRVF